MHRHHRLLVSALLLASSCGGTPPTPGDVSTPAASLPSFTTQTEWTDVDTLALGDNDDFDSILMGGPYYAGRHAYDIPALSEYGALRASTVSRAIEQTMAVRDAAIALQKPTTQLQEAVITFTKDATKADKTTKGMMRPVADAFVGARVKEEALKASIDALVVSTDAPLAHAALEYQKTVLALELASTVQSDLARSLGICAHLSSAGLVRSDDVGRLAGTLDAACEKVAFSEPLTTLQSTVVTLGDTLDRLDRADALFARATIDAARLQLPDLKAKVDGLQPRDGLDADTIALAKEQLTAIEGALAQLDTTLVVPAAMAHDGGFFPLAYADGYLSSALGLLKSGASVAASATKTAASYTWSGVKLAASATKTTAGVLVDLTKATVDSTTDAILGATNGKSLSDVAATTKGHFTTVAQNFTNGTSGAQVYADAGALLEGVEESGKKLAESAVASTVGSGWTSWIAGHTAKTTIGMFTGFGKGIYKLGNPTSTKGQLAEGALEVGLSFVGGSKVLVKGTQVMKGAPTAMKSVTLKTINVMEKEAAASEIALLKSINAKILKSPKPSAADMQRLVMNSEAITAKEAVVTSLKAAGTAIDLELAALAKKGGAAIWTNLTTDAAKSFNDFVKESFTRSLSGLLEAARTAIGKSPKEFLNELISEKGDDLIQSIARTAIDGLPLYGAVDFTGTYTAMWNTGSATMPFTVKVEGSALAPSITYSSTENGATSSVTVGGAGVAKEDGSASGTLQGGTALTGSSGSITGTVTGSFTGTISQDSFAITGSITAVMDGVLPGQSEPLSETLPFTLVLKRQ